MDETLLSRLESIEQRLNRIENIMGGAKPRPVTRAPTREPISERPLPPVSPEIPKEEESSSASRVLGTVGALCFVGAAGFLIRLAISVGWLTPERQIVLAGLFGLFLIATGLYFRSRDARYLSLLSAAGVIVLDLAMLGGHGIYSLYGAETAVIGIALVSVLSVYLYTVFRSEWYAVLAVIGAYSGLFVLKSNLDPAAITTYYLVWDVAFAMISLGVGSRTMILLAAYLGIGGFFIKSTLFANTDRDLLLFTAIVQAVQFALFAMTSVTFSVRRERPLSAGEAWSFFPVVIFFYGTEYALLHDWYAACTPWVALGFGAALYLLYFLGRKGLETKSLPSATLLSAVGSVVLLHAVYFNLLSDSLQLWAGPVALFGLPLLWRPLKLGKENICYTISIGIVTSLSLAYVFLGHQAERGELIALSGAYVLVFALLYLIIGKVEGGIDRQSAGFTVLTIAFSQYMLGTYRLFYQYGGEVPLIESFRPFWISSSWGGCGLLSLIVARARKDRTLAQASLLLLAATTLKVLLFDVASSSPVIRITCLLSTGVVLYAGGYVLRSIKKW